MLLQPAGRPTSGWLFEDGLSRDSSIHLQVFLTSLEKANGTCSHHGGIYPREEAEMYGATWGQGSELEFFSWCHILMSKASHKASLQSKAGKQTSGLYGRNRDSHVSNRVDIQRGGNWNIFAIKSPCSTNILMEIGAGSYILNLHFPQQAPCFCVDCI